MRTKVAILGKLPSKYEAPFNDLTYDIWTLNTHADNGILKSKRITSWFDLHSTGVSPIADMTRDNFPLEEVEKLVGGRYFNNSISYMIAYAILKGYKEIALYGMRFTSDKESRSQEYNNVRELIFFAKGRGVKVTSPADEIMLREYERYGV